MVNINSMTINNIIDFIRDESYIDNNNQIIKYNYNFKGNIIDFNNMGDNYINIIKDLIITNDTNLLLYQNIEAEEEEHKFDVEHNKNPMSQFDL